MNFHPSSFPTVTTAAVVTDILLSVIGLVVSGAALIADESGDCVDSTVFSVAQNSFNISKSLNTHSWFSYIGIDSRSLK